MRLRQILLRTVYDNHFEGPSTTNTLKITPPSSYKQHLRRIEKSRVLFVRTVVRFCIEKQPFIYAECLEAAYKQYLSGASKNAAFSYKQVIGVVCKAFPMIFVHFYNTNGFRSPCAPIRAASRGTNRSDVACVRRSTALPSSSIARLVGPPHWMQMT